MSSESGERNRQMKEFLESEQNWTFTAGECNFLIQVLAYVAQENPSFVPNKEGNKEPLNYQSLRSIVLLNEKLSGQLQDKASDASVILRTIHQGSDRVQ